MSRKRSSFSLTLFDVVLSELFPSRSKYLLTSTVKGEPGQETSTPVMRCNEAGMIRKQSVKHVHHGIGIMIHIR